jgi:hypothetical protein
VTPGQEALHEAMRVEQARIYGTTLPDTCSRREEYIPALGAGTGPAPAETIRALVDALSPVWVVPSLDRAGIEQAIARGLDDHAIVTALHVPLADVEHVRDDLDRLSA